MLSSDASIKYIEILNIFKKIPTLNSRYCFAHTWKKWPKSTIESNKTIQYLQDSIQGDCFSQVKEHFNETIWSCATCIAKYQVLCLTQTL